MKKKNGAHVEKILRKVEQAKHKDGKQKDALNETASRKNLWSTIALADALWENIDK